MAKKRIDVPRKTRDDVMREFHHRCAICGIHDPQLHHIDEDPTNNVPENLLPLCPNCHHLDHHDPTSPVDPRKLQLFRRYKDPLILSPQFEPLFGRFEFLLDLDEADFDKKVAREQADELVQFVSELEMGSFYGKKMKRLVKEPISMPGFMSLDTPDDVLRRWAEEGRKKYFNQLTVAVEQVLELAVELLRYQPWTWTPKVNSQGR